MYILDLLCMFFFDKTMGPCCIKLKFNSKFAINSIKYHKIFDFDSVVKRGCHGNYK